MADDKEIVSPFVVPKLCIKRGQVQQTPTKKQKLSDGDEDSSDKGKEFFFYSG
jgi:hypothetical protein